MPAAWPQIECSNFGHFFLIFLPLLVKMPSLSLDQSGEKVENRNI